MMKLKPNEASFLKKLIYWITNSNAYGIVYDKKTYIYNTLDQWVKQFNVSKRTIQNAIKYLERLGIIEKKFLSANKRDRTLYYTVNIEGLERFMGINATIESALTEPEVINNPVEKIYGNDPIFYHMYNKENKYKSYKWRSGWPLLGRLPC
jgi:hypothetical protein